MLNNCSTEVIELHTFFEDWFTGALPNTEQASNRLKLVLAPPFLMITPGAHQVSGKQLLANLRSMHGYYNQKNKPSHIWIENIEGQQLSQSLCLLRYEEWQGDSNKSEAKGRLSSALFKQHKQAPNNVQWMYLHETWIS